jgi:hypothetical protein
MQFSAFMCHTCTLLIFAFPYYHFITTLLKLLQHFYYLLFMNIFADAHLKECFSGFFGNIKAKHRTADQFWTSY